MNVADMEDDTHGNAGQFPGPGRTEKHLARGLEDLSHLFLSQVSPATPSAREGQNDSSGEVHPLVADWATTTGTHPSSAVNQHQLVSILHKSAGILEEGLRAIDADIPLEIGDAIDLVALDRRNQLAIIDVDASANDGLLARGISHVDWFARHVQIVRRMYPGYAIDFESEPRLFLIGPRFSPVLRCAVQKIAGPRITCITYNLVTLPNGTGILFQHA